jgi:hypothetical protein
MGGRAHDHVEAHRPAGRREEPLQAPLAGPAPEQRRGRELGGVDPAPAEPARKAAVPVAYTAAVETIVVTPRPSWSPKPAPYTQPR